MAHPFQKKKTNFNALIDNNQEGIWWKKAWQQGKKALAKSPKETQSRRLLFEVLEPRILMSADLSYGTATDLTLAYHAGNGSDDPAQFRLLDESDNIISSANAIDALDGGISITGTSGDDILKLDMASLSALNAAVNLTFLGEGADTLSVENDANFELSDSELQVGSVTFSLVDATDAISFESAELMGGNSANVFTLIGWSGDLTIDGGAGNDTLQGPDDDFDWQVTAANEGYVSGGGFFSSIENLEGGSGSDAFKIDLGGALDGLIDGGSGDNALVADNGDNEWIVIATDEGTLNGLSFKNIKNLIGGTGNDTFDFDDEATISGYLDGGAEDGDDTETEVNSISFAAYTDQITVALPDSAIQDQQGRVTSGSITVVGAFASIDSFEGGSSDDDEVIGPTEKSVVWTISGEDEFSVAEISFSDFQNLSGANNNTDVFVIEGLGNITGTIDGGTGGSDGLIFIDPTDEETYKAYNPSSLINNQSGTTSGGDAFSKAIDYAGMDYVNFFNKTDPLNPIISGSIFNDTITVTEDPDVAGGIKISYAGNIYKLSQQEVTSLVSLRIDGMEGKDTIIVEPLPTNFTGSLYLYGHRLQRADLLYPDMPEDDVYQDTVIFRDKRTTVQRDSGVPNDLPLASLTPYYLEVFTDHVQVEDGVRIQAGDDGIFFRNRDIGVATFENLSPILPTTRNVSVDIGKNAILEGGSIYFVLQAEDKSFSDIIGASNEVSKFVIEPLTGLLEGAVSMPVKILVKKSEAKITVKEGAQLLSAGTLGMYATAVSDSSGAASSSLISIGYAQAKAYADIQIQKDVVITAADAVVITSTANSTANISASTTREVSSTPNPGSKQIALAIGVANADVVSYVTVAEGAAITAGKTANVTAGGDINAEASAEAGMYAEGAAGLAFGIEISNADIHTIVNGSITALMEPGAVVKLEIDPTVKGFDYKSTQTINRLENGKVVKLMNDFNDDLPKGTLLTYIGNTRNGSIDLTPEGTGAGFSTTGENYADDSIWEIKTPDFGYVDYDFDRVYLGDTALVTEDTITYANRRGTSIGNMVDGREYYVIQDDVDGYYKFAETETQAIRASLGYESGNIVNLIDESGTAIETNNNERSFDGADVDASTDSISLPWGGGVFNTFELGQAVVYHEGSAPIAGLVDGNTYYVAASTNQTNLQGNTRFTDKQVIGLSESENESRGGVLIDIGPTTGNGYKLAAKHVLDSDFATGIGVVAKLGAENNASASAGLTEEDANPGYWSKFTSAVETNLPDTLLGKLTKKYSEAQKANAGASNELSVAGALAFSFVEHSVLTDVGSSAVLKSNEDLEVKALISQKYTLGAESNVEPSLNSADTVASVAINIGIFNNTAIATIHSKLDSSGNVTQAAELDGLRATRIISDVTYPFLTRFDQYIPLSWGEFVDGIRTDGLDAITKYFNSTLGLKDSFFNTWVAATAEAEKLSIAGSVNVMILDNVSQAVVEAGVKINQDDTWHVTGADNDHPNQADNQSDGKGEEVVSIEATNYQQVINMTGIFALPGLELDIIPNPSADPKASKLKLKKELSKNVLGTGGGSKGGAGGSIFVNVQNNTTHAIVEDEAQIYSGADGGFNMKAEEALFNIHLAQSAGKGGGFAVAGSVVYAGQDSDTLVQVGDTAEITGRDMRLYAGDLTTTASWAGGVAVGDGVGVGFSLAINDFDRKTRAVVGNPDVLTAVAGAPGSSSYINVTDKVDVLAKVDGDLWSFSVAGAVASGDTGGTPPPQDSPLKAQKLLGTDVEPPASGFGAAAALSVNIVKDNTQASIVNAGKLKAGSVTVTATDDFFQVAVTGGASFAKGQAGSTSGSTSLAGAFSFNELDVKTRAFILDTDIVTAGDIIVDAKRTGDLITLSAGGSIATGQGGKAIAGSVSINLIFNVTEAYLSGVDAEVDGDVSVTASDNSRIIAVGGGLAFALGGKIGVGLGVGANILGSDVKPTITRAYISDSTLVIGGDSLTVTATNDNVDSDGRIFAITAGVGVAGGPDATVGLGAMLSVNLITNTTEAYVRNTKIDEELDENGDPIDPKLNTRVEARDDSGIIAIGGAVGVSTGNAIGAAIGYNEIDNDVKAYLEDVDLTADGTLTVKATSDAEIGGVALGVAVAAGPSGKIAGAGSLLINQITNTIDAHIIDSDVTVGGDVLIQASDNSLIVSISGGIAVGIGSKAAIGAAISYNLIQNRNLAYIESSTVHSTTGAVTLSAADEALLVALAVGGAGAQDFALGGSVMVNSIANTVDAHISKNSDVFARTDLSVTARESSSLVAIGGGIGVAVKGSAVGAAIAYNYVGGSFDDANPNLISRDSTATNKISAYIDDSKAVADGNITVAGGFTPPVDATAGHSSITAKVAAFNPNAANAVDLTSNTLTFATAHGYEDGQAVTYRNGGGDSIEGLTDGEVYYVKRIDDNSLKLQTKNLEVQSFDPSDDDVIDLNANTITFAEDHGYQDGDVVVYYNGSETDDTDSLGGLNNVTQYVVQVIDAKTIKLQTQNSGGQLEVVNLTSIGDGTYHSLHHEKLEVVDLETKGSGASHSLRVTQIGIGDTQIALPVELSSGITSITLGGAGAANFALGGSVSISFIKNSIDARISNVSATENQEVKAGGTLSVSADDSSKIFALAGGVAISVSGPQQSGPGVAVGVAVAANIIDNAILATVVDASLVADGDIEVSAKSEASINAITLAGAVAAALKSDSAVAVAGGGSIAVNEVGNTVEASITGSDSVESTAGDIRVTADDIASIDAVAIAATVSAAFGLSSGGSVAIGFSLGFNTIDNSVDAFVKNVDSVKTKTAGKGVTVEANAEGRHRFNLTDSSQFNDLITGLDDAAVKDSDDPDTVPDPDHPEIPTDEAEIDAKADAAFLTTLKATFKTNGVSLNGKAEDLKISTLKAGSEWLVFDGRSTYRIAKVLDSNGNPVRFEVRGGNIQAVSVAASVALAGSLGGLGLAISGAGAGAANNILTDTRAYIDGSSVDSAGDVRVASANNAVINATVVAISVAASVGDVGAAASLGIAVARNQIGYEADTSETYDYDLDDANVAYLEKGDKVRINKGVLSGDVYEYVPDTSYTYTNTLTTTQSSWPTEVNPGDTVKVGNKVYRLKFDEDGLSNSSGVNLGTQDYTSANSVWEEIKVDFRGQDYSNTGLWKRVGSDKAPNDVAAYITNSSITQADDVTVIALSGQSINAGVGAGSAAVTGGSNAAVGISGAGVGNENKVAVNVSAYIDSNGAKAGPITADSLTLTARDNSAILAEAGAASIAAAFGGTGAVAFSLGVSIALNDIDNTVEAYIVGKPTEPHLIKTTVGDVSLTAEEAASIRAVSVAASFAVAFGSTVGVAVSGAGAVALNVINGATNAYLQNTNIDSARHVTLLANNTASITSTVVGISVAAGVGGAGAGVGVSIGVAVAINRIGESGNLLEVQAYSENSSVKAGGDLTMTANSAQSINAGVGAGSAAIAVGGTVGVGVAGAGVYTENTIKAAVKAYIDGDGATGIFADSVSLQADDQSTISARAGAAALALSFAGTGAVSISLGIALARNDISNIIEASISNANNGVVARSGNVELDAEATATITVDSVAASLAAGVSLVGIAIAGAGADGINLINNTVQAYIDDSTVVAESAEVFEYEASATPNELRTNEVVRVPFGDGHLLFQYIGSNRLDPNNELPPIDLSAENYNDASKWLLKSTASDITVEASSSATITSLVGAVAAAVGGGLVGAAGSIGVSVSRNLIGYDSADDDTGGGNKVLAYVSDSGLTASGKVSVKAETTDRISAEAFAGSVALSVGVGALSLAGSGVEITNKMGTQVHAYVSDSNVLALGDITVKAVTDSMVTKAEATGAAVSVAIGIGGSVSIAASIVNNLIANDVQAYLSDSDGTHAVISGGNIEVLADVSQAKVDDISAVTASVSVGLVGASGGGVELINTVDNDVFATIEGELDVVAMGDVTVHASEEVDVEADASNVTISVSLGAALGVSVIENELKSSVRAAIEGASVSRRARINATNIVVKAESENDATKTKSVGVSGSLVGVTGNSAKVTITTSVIAETSNAELVAEEFVSILANADNYARAESNGGAFGLGAVGAMVAEIDLGKGESVYEVQATVGEGSTVTAGTLNITASGTDDLVAESIAGSAAAVAATGAQSDVDSDYAARARLGNNVTVEVTSFLMTSAYSQAFDAQAENYSVALASGTGAGINNDITTKANVEVGTGARVTARDIVIDAKNEVVKDAFGDDANLQSGSASVVGLTLLLSDTDIGTSTNPFEAKVDIGSGAVLTATGNNANPGVFRVGAATDIRAVDRSKLESVSGFNISAIESRVDTVANATINVTGASLENKSGDLQLTTRSASDVSAGANLMIISVISGAGAGAYSTQNVNNSINVTDSTLKGSDVQLYAGRNNIGVPNVLLGYANSQVLAISLGSIAVPVVAADIYENNTINLAGTTSLKALEDVSLLAVEGVGEDNRAKTDADVLSLSFIPYAVSVPDGGNVTSTNKVIVGSNVSIEAGINSSAVMLIRAVNDTQNAPFDINRIGTLLTVQEKDDLDLPSDVAYEYGAVNLDEIRFTVTTGTIVKVLAGHTAGGDAGKYYQFKKQTSGENILLEKENYADTSRWEVLTTASRPANATTNTPYRPTIAEIEASNSQYFFYTTATTTTLAEQLKNQLYVIKPVTVEAPRLSYRNLGTLLFQQRETILGWIASHSSNAEAVARYEVQLAALDATLRDLGLLENATNTITNPDGTTRTVIQSVVNKNLDALFIDLPSIYAAPGSVFLEGIVYGSQTDTTALSQSAILAQIKANGGAKIEIDNRTPFAMTLADTVIRDNKRVAVVDGEYVTQQAGNVYLNNVSLTTVNNASAKTIEIKQKALDPLSRYNLNGLTVPDVDRGLYVVGDVINEAGNVTIKNFDGSISVSGEIRAASVTIDAKTDFALNTEDWLHTNRDPRQYLNYDALVSFAQFLGSGTTLQYGTGNITYFDPNNLLSGVKSQNLASAINVNESRILAQGRISITARYLNVNGLIQSGVQTVTLHVADTFTANRTQSFLDDDGNVLAGISFGTDRVPVDGYFDYEKQAIVVDDIIPTGGEITIAGKILSTGNGQLKVAHGYTSVDIDNDSKYKLILNRIDTSKPRDGIITIIDSVAQTKTEYKIDPNKVVTESVYRGQLTQTSNEEQVSRIVYTLQGTATYNLGDSNTADDVIQYGNPANSVAYAVVNGATMPALLYKNQLYVWVEGQESTRTEVRVYEQKSFNLLGFDWDGLAKDDSWIDRDIFYTDKTRLLESEVVGGVSGLAQVPGYALGDAYTLAYVQVNDEAVKVTPGITTVEYVGTDTTKGVTGDRYQLDANNVNGTLDLKLPDQNYLDTNLWKNVTDDTGDADVDFDSDFVNYTFTSNTETFGGGWMREKTVRTTTTTVQGIKDYYTHTLKADYPINVVFAQGPVEPSIVIHSVNDVFMQGNIIAPDIDDVQNSISITSVKGSVSSVPEVAILGVSPTIRAGDFVNVNIEGDKGALDVIAGLDTADTKSGKYIILNAVKDAFEADSTSSFVIKQVLTEKGDVLINAPEGISAQDANALVKGNLIELKANKGAIGAADLALTIDSDVLKTGGFAALAEDNIHISEKTGDLKLALAKSWAA